MKKKRDNFDFLFADCTDDNSEAARWVHTTLQLQNPITETFPLWNRDGARALEFLRFYAQNSELVGWRKYFLGNLVSDSLCDAIEECEEQLPDPEESATTAYLPPADGPWSEDLEVDGEDEEECEERLAPLSEEEQDEITLILRSLTHDRRLMHFLRYSLHPSVRASYPKWLAFYKSVFGDESV